MIAKPPIVLLVSERSGSNMLRTLLGNHPGICAPVSPHLFAEFYPFRSYYGDLHDPDNARLLVEDMFAVVNHPYHGWDLEADREDLLGEIHSVVSGVDTLYRHKASKGGMETYCTKEIRTFEFIDQIRAELPGARFVHLVRDPRDHVASWMKRPIHLHTPFDAAQKWTDEQNRFLDAADSRGLKYVSIRYEDLIADTEGEMNKIFDFLGLDPDSACYQTNSKNTESGRNPYWRNLSKPVMRSNSGSYSKQLTPEDILIIESISRGAMERFGYELTTAADWKPDRLFYFKLLADRNKGKKRAEENVDSNMGMLVDKLNLIRRIRSNRRAQMIERKPVCPTRDSVEGFSGYPLIGYVKRVLLAIFGKKAIKFLVSAD